MGLKLFRVLDQGGEGQGERAEVDSQRENALSIVLKNYEQTF